MMTLSKPALEIQAKIVAASQHYCFFPKKFNYITQETIMQPV